MGKFCVFVVWTVKKKKKIRKDKIIAKHTVRTLLTSVKIMSELLHI